MYWKSFFIFISDKLRNELIDIEYQKRYKVTKVSESIDIAYCVLLDDERILSSHDDKLLRLWSTSDCECFMNWFSLILDSSSYKHGWWMSRWNFLCPPFCHIFFLTNLQMPKVFILVLVISMYLLKKNQQIMSKSKWSFIYDILLFTFHITIFSSETKMSNHNKLGWDCVLRN